jgi:hypothetical protein
MPDGETSLSGGRSTLGICQRVMKVCFPAGIICFTWQRKNSSHETQKKTSFMYHSIVQLLTIDISENGYTLLDNNLGTDHDCAWQSHLNYVPALFEKSNT